MKISVIVPVHNSESTLRVCLTSIRNSIFDDYELVVVDDRSTDNSRKIAEELDAKTISNTHLPGPAGARNAGAHAASGDILFFIDSDVSVRPDSIGRVAEAFDRDPDLAAMFGSYDKEPGASNFLSQYKNLFHHFIHQNSSEIATTFWAGCGAIRRDLFLACRGFDEAKYPYPSIEDIELGGRLYRQGHKIRLDKQLQVKHWKRWTWRSLLTADIFRRAYPWTQLILEHEEMPADLNLQPSHRISALLSGSLVITTLFLSTTFVTSEFLPATLVLFAFILGALIFLNRKLYAFFVSHRGWIFTLFVLPWHFFYYLYSAITFVSCWLIHQFRKWKIPFRGHTRNA